MAQWEQVWDDFEEALRAKLHEGHHNYGDRSFARSPEELLKELSEEAIDLAGWGLILWARAQNLRERLARMMEETVGKDS